MTTETLGNPKDPKMENPFGSFTFIKPPPPAGWYILRRGMCADFRLGMPKKPKAITRFLMKHLLEIDWEDE